MEIAVAFLDSDVQFVDVTATTKVGELKEEICNREDAKAAYFEVSLAGDVLDDDKVLIDEGAAAGMTLDMTLSRQGRAVFALGRETTYKEVEDLVKDVTREEELDSLQTLVDAGNINVNNNPIRGRDSHSALIYTAMASQNIKAIEAIANCRDFDINTAVSPLEGATLTPLTCACFTNSVAVVKAVMAIPGLKIADHPLVESSTHTPMAVACELNNIDIIKLLVAEPSVDVNDGSLLLAVDFNNLEIVQILMAHTDINPTKALGLRTPLHEACKKGYLDIIKELLKHPDVNVNAKVASRSPLFVASTSGRLDVVEYLLSLPELRFGPTDSDPAARAASKGYKQIAEKIRNSPQYCLESS